MIKETLKKFIPFFLLSWYHFLLAFLGAVFYGFPSRLRVSFAEMATKAGQGFGGQAKKLKVIGVTGTNGKSTVIELAAQILREAGYKVASISSIQFRIQDKVWPNLLKQTMPGRFQLQKFLRQALDSGCSHAVLEVTSEGIKQYRHKFIDFDVATFTNLTPEHIEAHGSFEKYREAKGKLFQATENIHVVNTDDNNAGYFLQFPAKKKYTYGLNQGDVNAQNTKIKLQLIGDFNVYNALAAICIGLSQGINLEICQKTVDKIKEIPGRMEIVISEPFKVFVDYAFTPNALEKVYQTLTDKLKNLKTEKLICVLGAAGGGRDKWKRPVLGEIAAKYCDEIIITNEDPYDENPMEIIEQVARGAFEEIRVNPRSYPRKSASIHKILDRREAIKKALSLAKLDDVVIITGKGSEPWICVEKGKKIPWDDRQVVREEFKKIKAT